MTKAGSVEIDVKLTGLAKELADLKRELAGVKNQEIPVGFKVDANGKLRDAQGRFAKGFDAPVNFKPDTDTKPVKDKLAGLKKFADDVFTGIGQGIGQKLTGAALGAIGGGIDLIGGTAKESLGLFKDFSKEITAFGALSGATSGELKALSDEAKRVGKETSKTPVEAAKAAVELTKLGFSAGETRKELKGVVALDEASGLRNLALAAEIAGGAYNVFGIEAQRTSDIVAATANATAAGAEDFKQAISEAGGVAVNNNQSFETLAATFGLLRQAGASAAVSATGVKSLIQRLGAPASKESQNAIAELGVQIRTADGEMRNILDLIPEFRQALGSLDPQKKADLVRTIFGDEGAPPFLNLLSISQQKIESVRNTIENSGGSAAKAAQDLLKGFDGAIEQMEGSIETVKLNLGEAIAPAFEGAAKGVTSIANELLNNEDIFKSLNESAKDLGDVLKDPELTKPLAEGLAEVISILSNEAASAVKEFAGFLKSNPGFIREMAEGFTNVVSILAKAVGLAGQLASKVAAGVKELEILSKGGADKVGSNNAVINAGGKQTDVDAIEKRVQERLNNNTYLNKLGFGGEFDEEKIRAQETQDFLTRQAYLRRRGAGKREGNLGDLAKSAASLVGSAAEKAGLGNIEIKVPDNVSKAVQDFKLQQPKPKPNQPKPGTAKPPAQIAKPEDFALEFKKKEAAIEDERAKAQLAAKNRVGGAGDLTKIDIDATKKTIALKEQELAKIKELREKRLLSEKDAAERTLTVEREMRQQKTKLAELEQQQAVKVIQERVDASKRATDLIVRGFDQEKAANDRLTASLGVQKQLLDSRAAKQQALSDRQAAATNREIGKASEAVSLAEKLQNQDTGVATRVVARTQLAQIGGGETDPVKLAQKKADLEGKADQQKLVALAKQQQFERAGLELDLKRQEIAAKSNVLEAQKAALLAKQNVVSAQGEVDKARKTGSKNDIANAESALALAKQQAAIASQQIGSAQENLSAQKELAANAKATLDIKQATAKEELKGQNDTNARRRALEVAEIQDRQIKQNDERLKQLTEESELLQKRSTLLNQQLELQQKLISSRSAKDAAVSEARQSQLQGRIGQTDEAIGLAQAIRDPNTGDTTRAVAAQQLAGIAGSATADPLALLQQRNALEREADQERMAALMQQQQAEQLGLQLDLKRQELSAQTNLLEAKKAALIAEQNVVLAQQALQKAKASGDPKAIAEAERGLKLAQEQFSIAGQGLQLAQDGVKLQDEFNKSAQETLAIKQDTARAEQGRSNESNERRRQLEQAKFADEQRRKESEAQQKRNREQAEFQRRQNQEREQLEESIRRKYTGVNRQVQLEFAGSDKERKQLQRQFEREDAIAARTAQLEAPIKEEEFRLKQDLEEKQRRDAAKFEAEQKKKLVAGVAGTGPSPANQAANQELPTGAILERLEASLQSNFDRLIDSIQQLANAPRSLSVSAPDPIGQIGQITQAISQQRGAGARI